MRSILGIVGSLLLGTALTLIPLAFGATASITRVLHSPMLLLDRWMAHSNIIMNNGHRILLFLAVNVAAWATLLYVIIRVWLHRRAS